MTKDDLTRENGDVNRLFGSLIGTEKKACGRHVITPDDVLMPPLNGLIYLRRRTSTL